MKYFQYSFLFAALFVFSGSLLVSAQETGAVKGKVRNTRGDAIGGAVVSARQQGREIKSVTAGGDGKFVLSGLPAGVYNIVFDKNGYSTGVKYNVEIKKGKTGDLGDQLKLSPDQGTLVIVKGSVFNQNDRSVGGARVEIAQIQTDGAVKKVASGYTNISGEFTFKFPEGAAQKLRVTASLKDAEASKEIEVGSAAIYRLALSLKVKE